MRYSLDEIEELYDKISPYEVDEAGAIYWVLANDIPEAVRLWLELEDVRETLEIESSLDLGVRLADFERLGDLRFRGQEPGGDVRETSMLEEMMRDPTARVVACSEWDF